MTADASEKCDETVVAVAALDAVVADIAAAVVPDVNSCARGAAEAPLAATW